MDYAKNKKPAIIFIAGFFILLNFEFLNWYLNWYLNFRHLYNKVVKTTTYQIIWRRVRDSNP